MELGAELGAFSVSLAGQDVEASKSWVLRSLVGTKRKTG
jgi:hypothetical protein